MVKRIRLVALVATTVLACMLAVSGTAGAHSGGLDGNGGHHCRQRGYDSGSCAPLNSYHCHRSPCTDGSSSGGSSGGSSGSSSGTTRSAPAAPPDTDPPERPVIHRSAVEDGLVVVAVTAERGSRIDVHAGTERLHRATATGQEQALRFRAADGDHRLAVTATDAAGNVSEAATVSVTVDTTAPEQPEIALTPAERGKPDTVVRVTGEPRSLLELVVTDEQGAAVGEPTQQRLAADGTAEVKLRLPNGGYVLEGVLVDGAGNRSAAATTPVQVAVPPPGRPTLRLAGDRGASPLALVLSGDPETTAELVIRGEGRSVRRSVELGSSGRAELDVELPDGGYRVSAVLVDPQGQRSETAQLADVVVKAAPPELDVVEIGELATAGKIAFALRVEPGTVVTLRTADGEVDERLDGTGSVQTVVLALPAGAYDIAVTATDEYGNATSVDHAVLVASEFTASQGGVVVGLLLALAFAARRLWRRIRRRGADTSEVAEAS